MEVFLFVFLLLIFNLILWLSSKYSVYQVFEISGDLFYAVS